MPKDTFKHIPAFKLLMLLLGGFLLSDTIRLDISVQLTVGAVCLIISGIALKYDVLKKFYVVTVIASGMIIGSNFHENKLEYPDKITPNFSAIFKGKVESITRSDSMATACFVRGQLNSSVIGEMKDSRIYLKIRKVKGVRIDEGDDVIANVTLKVPYKAQFREDFYEQLFLKANDAQWLGYTSDNRLAVTSKATGFTKLINVIRNEINFRVNLLFSTQNAGIVNALITGKKSGIDYETMQDFSFSGTAHVLAVSGMHIGIISSILVIFLSFVRIRWIKFILFSTFLICYIIITGYQPSAIRAGVMSLVIGFAYLMERRINLLNVLSFAILLIFLSSPSMVFSAGFQMSTLAILGIGVFTPIIRGYMDKLIISENTIINLIKSSLSLSISVNTTVAPLVAFYFGFYSIFSPFANLIVIPLFSMATVLGILALGLSYISISVSGLYCLSTEALINISRSIVTYFGENKFSVMTRDPILLLTIVITVITLYVLLSENKKKLIFKSVLGTMILTIIIMLYKPDDSIKIFPRSNTVVVEKGDMIMVIDRKPRLNPVLDLTLFKYIINKDIKYNILINGNNGIRLTDELKKIKETKIYFVDILTINKIIKEYDINDKIFNKIDIKL